MSRLQLGGVPLELLIVAGVAVAALAFLILRKWIPALRVAGGPVEVSALRRADRATAELEDANRTIIKLQAEKDALEKERSLASVIELIENVAAGVTLMLEKMADMNGGLQASAKAHEEAARGMEASTKAIEFLAGQIITRDA